MLSPASPSALPEWRPVLERLGIGLEQAAAVEARARINGVPFQKELMVAGLVSEERVFRALADELGIAFMAEPDPQSLLMSGEACLRALRLRDGIPLAHSATPHGPSRILLAPGRVDIAALRAFVARHADAAERLCFVTPAALRRAVLERARPLLVRQACNGLFDRAPDLSARIVATAAQGFLLGALAVALPVCWFLAAGATQMALHCVLSFFFFACVALRLAVSAGGPRPAREPPLSAPDPAEMPVYTVLVALYREAAMVPELMVALGKIVWPRAKLEVKLVCEADDAETLAALEAQGPRPWVEVIAVPPEGPRTKPKALAYALPACSGDFVVLYDAEDKPHPLQLMEAWQRFRDADEDLACLQAPLSISNMEEGILPGLFGIEYAGLFHGLLPWLARRIGFFPLGGTSNHFRRAALDRTGAWDPYNVTEDADLGLRLKRFGYRSGTLSYPTFEDAPDRLGVWMAQRTRWFKGWARLL